MAKIRVNGVEYPVPEMYDLGELADMEDIAGQGYDYANPGPKGLIAIAYVSIRRVDPTVTVDRLRALSPSDIEGIKEDIGDARPPEVTTTKNGTGFAQNVSGAPSSSGSDGSQAATPVSSGVPD